jgi:hypothetical protein
MVYVSRAQAGFDKRRNANLKEYVEDRRGAAVIAGSLERDSVDGRVSLEGSAVPRVSISLGLFSRERSTT